MCSLSQNLPVQNHFVLELVGYAGSVLIAISLMMTSILRLRVINVVGSAAFAIYGLLIGAYPVAALNGFIVFVNVFHLARIFRAKQYFQLLPLKPDSQYLPYFLKFYDREIRRILPDFEYRPAANQLLLFVLRDCAPAGVFIAEQRSDGVLRVILDFVIPPYRDLKIGRFLFVEQAAFFKERGVKEIMITPRTAEFGAYLVKVGFQPAARSGDFHIGYAQMKTD
jgi:hypothetical protein